jgi:antitoxin CptB
MFVQKVLTHLKLFLILKICKSAKRKVILKNKIKFFPLRVSPMSIDNKIAYRCKRGLLELDLLLNNFYKVSVKKMSSVDKMQLLNLLEIDDFELWDLIQKPSNKDSKHSNLINLINSSEITKTFRSLP